MCPSPLGRLQTRTAILFLPAVIGAILSLVTDNEGYIVIIGIYLLVGVTLDLLFYPLVINWQPPWLTFVLGLGEFVIVYLLAQVLEVGLEPAEAIIWYWVAWSIAVASRIVFLPIISLSWIENAGEFRSTGWSVPTSNEPIPILAVLPTGGAPGALAREFSTVNQIPDDIRNLPSPSGVHRRPGS